MIAQQLTPFNLHSDNAPPIFAALHCIKNDTKANTVVFRLEFWVALAAYCLPKFAQKRRADFLWQADLITNNAHDKTDHTTKNNACNANACFEAFFGFADGRYLEVNAAPDGAFATYQFAAYRTPRTLPPPIARNVVFEWLAFGRRRLANLPKDNRAAAFTHAHMFYVTLPAMPTNVNLAAVLQLGAHNALFYALQHKMAADFHDQSLWVNI